MIHTFNVFILKSLIHTHKKTQNIAYATHSYNVIALIEHNYLPHRPHFNQYVENYILKMLLLRLSHILIKS